ncbi:MAG TPA: hypothetical protein VEC11_07680 [Allosphingosinicella sp.]|nr:hypothetical protein [Allosphingosinicella sp.]
MTSFACDLSPADTFAPLQPRVRFNFSNGWSGSLVVRTGEDQVNALIGSVAAAPTGQWGKGETELGPTEAMADEAIEWLYQVSRRPTL